MLETWARGYADRWGLPDAAVHELQRVIDAVGRGDLSDGEAHTRPPSTEAPQSFPDTVITPTWDAGERYEDLGPIGEGGMGEVRRVWDETLHRSVAMKVLRRDLAEREDLVLRFEEESQATGQLEHPGIVPVYDSGRLADGRPYFTMKEIRGRSLLDVIADLHAESVTTWGTTATGWSFHRLISVFQQVCEAIAYAHSRGVLHRDLKPTNVMVGAFGEVVVMDWGLAKVAGSGATGATPSYGGGQVVTQRSRGGLYVTRSGSVAGTPNYMPPEQARGEAGLVGPWSDVYALGALLYEILADRAPYEGEDLDDVVRQVLDAPPPPPYARWQRPQSDEPQPEDGLRTICLKAMARDLKDRYMDAGSLAEAIAEWLNTAGARDRGILLVQRADLLEPDLVALRKRVATLRADASTYLAALPNDATPEAKREGWALEDRATELDRELRAKEARYANLLQAALASVPGLREAAERLDALTDPEADAPAAGTEGFLSLQSSPSGAPVTLRRIEAVARRLQPIVVAGFEAPMFTPIDRAPLPAGAWAATVESEGCAAVTVLLRVRPGELATTAPPGTPRAVPVVLPIAGSDPLDSVRVPAGWFWCGGDAETADSLPRAKVWVETFLIRRDPITVGEFTTFLAALDRMIPPDQVDRFAPLGVERGATGWLVPDPDLPVHGVTFDAAQAYASWWSERSGRAWRLPRDREWEKAARGVDERRFPWGNFLDPSWCCIADSHRGAEPTRASVHAYPLDVSPYGVRGLGGNVRDWVVDDRAPRGGPVAQEHRYVRGGWFSGISQFARCALRYRPVRRREEGVGFRLVASSG